MNIKRFGKFTAPLAALLLTAAVIPASGEDLATSGITTADLRLRKGSSTTSAVLLTIPRGTMLEISGISGDFYKVTYNGRTGYASVNYITGADTVSPPAGNASLYTAITASSDADGIRALQNALKELGYYTSSVDGKYGPGTRNAVSAFQSKNALTQTGTADPVTLQMLFEGTPKNSRGKAVKVSTLPPLTGLTIGTGSRGDQVTRLQERLKELGYLSSADGVYGDKTAAAVKAFQKKMGLTQTGTADPSLQAVLYSSQALSASAASATASPTSEEDPVYPFTTVTLASVNLRKGKGTNTTRITTIPDGASISVKKTDGDYLYVTYKSWTGYIPAEYANVPARYLSGKVLPSNLQAQLDYLPVNASSDPFLIRTLQSALKELGFYSGSADGLFGSDTQNAVKAFQKQNGLRPDGEATPELQQYLYEKKVKNASGRSVYAAVLPPLDGQPMQEGDIGYQVADLKRRLNSLGFWQGDYSDEYDRKTANAVKTFQKEFNLTQDGKAGEKTLSVLYIVTSYDDPSPTDTPVFTPAPTPLTPQNVVTVRTGSRGDAVFALQQALLELGYSSRVPDGICTKDDENAIRAFQKRNRLTQDGIAGYDTQRVLYSGSALPAEAAATATVKPTPVPTAVPTPAAQLLKRGSKGADVISLQKRLAELGYYSGSADGIYGTGTENAVKAFQKRSGLSQDGQAGTGTLSALWSSSARRAEATKTPAPTATPAPSTVLKLGSTGDEVKKMQKRLIELGYLSSGMDGSFGNKTFSAVYAFQQYNKLATDGIAGTATLNRLYSSSAVKAPAGGVETHTPTPRPASAFVVPKASDVRYANWYTVIRDLAKAMPDVVIYDPDTGLHYNLHMFSLGKHADAEPPTAEDTRIMYQVIGYNSWTPHAVWVIFEDGQVFLASTHSHGHEVDHTSGNDLEGHVCIHFPREMSEAEKTGPYAVSHQNEIQTGLKILQSLSKH